MTAKEKVIDLCKQRGISVHKLEMDCGFSNASVAYVENIGAKRLETIANYFGVPVQYFYTDDNQQKYMTEDEHRVLDLIRVKPYLKELLFAGGKIDEAQVEAITYTINAMTAKDVSK